MDIESIQKEIDKLFQEYKYPALTKRLKPDSLFKFADVQSHRLLIDDLGERMMDIFWSVASVQLSIGYMMIAKKSSVHYRGITKTIYDPSQVTGISMGNLHFWHHAFLARECIYRVWERLNSLIRAVCYPEEPEEVKKLYFSDLIEKLAKDPVYMHNEFIGSLKGLVKHREKAACLRNFLSHEASSLTAKITIEPKNSIIYQTDGLPFPTCEYKTPDLVQEIEAMKDAYLKFEDAINVICKFIDSIPSKVIIKPNLIV